MAIKIIVTHIFEGPLQVSHTLNDSSGTASVKEMFQMIIELLKQGNIRMGQLEEKVEALSEFEAEATQAQEDLDSKILDAIERNQTAVQLLAQQHADDLAKIEAQNAEIADLRAQIEAGNNDPELIAKLDAAIESNQAAIAKSKEQAVLIDGLNAFLGVVVPPDASTVTPVESVSQKRRR